MAVTIHGDSFRTGEPSGAIAGFSKFADETALGVEDLHAVVQGIGDVQVAIVIDGYVGRQGEIAGVAQGVFLARRSDGTEELVVVGIEYGDLVFVCVGHVEEAVLAIDGDPAGSDRMPAPTIAS